MDHFQYGRRFHRIDSLEKSQLMVVHLGTGRIDRSNSHSVCWNDWSELQELEA